MKRFSIVCLLLLAACEPAAEDRSANASRLVLMAVTHHYPIVVHLRIASPG